MKQAAIAAALLLMTGVPRAQGPASLLLVLNKSDATLSIIDPVSGKTTATVPTGPNPHEVTTSADGRFAITTNYGGDSLSVIDIAARKEAHRVALPDLRQPHGIHTVGGLAVFTAEGNRSIAGYDVAANRIAWRFATEQDGTHMVTASRDGRTLFTSNMGANTISVLVREGERWRPTHVLVGAGPEGLDLSPDGRELWTAQFGDGRVSIIDVGAKKVSHTFDVKTKRSNRLKFTRDGRFVLISDMEGGELVVVDVKSRTIVKRLRVGQMPEGILVPSDGDRIYVAVTGENRVAVVDVNTLEMVQTIATGRGPDGMAWAAPPRR
jgi:YVTN family beta-propeller protein